MDNEILLQEQKQLEEIQRILSEKIKLIEKHISFREQKNMESFEYMNSEQLDKYEIADVYGNIHGRDLSISELTNDKNMFQRILPKPFFAKISIKEGYDEPENYYIGLKGVDYKDDQIVIDWRTPLASLLYFSSLGEASFDAPAGKVKVDLLLKRQFRLVPNKIVSYIDTDTKIDDNILQEILSKNTSSHMTNIVQTIQEEQNAIIRLPPQQTVIINGIAGSGKTSIAMHRIAYILYANKGNISSQNIMVISPNQLFSSYIGDLLPELGEENVYSCSMMQMLKNAKLLPKSIGDKMSMVDSQFFDKERKQEIDRKFSIDFFDEVNTFLENFDLSEYIEEAFRISQYNNSLDKIKTINTKKTSDVFERADYTITLFLRETYPQAKESLIEKTKNKLLLNLRKILTAKILMNELYDNTGLHYFESDLAYEDAPIYAYLNYKLNGIEPNYYIKHIFVDEMQDYDAFSIYLIKKLYPDATMTLAGDYNQNIMSKHSNLGMLRRMFPKIEVDKLDVSYRSTNEIIEFAQNILNLKSDNRLVRHGDKPKLIKVQNEQDFIDNLHEIIKSYSEEKIAIITKTYQEAYKLSKILNDFDFIKDEKNAALLTSNRIITTIYLSKGLEYDRVILYNVNENNYVTQLDKQNLYVACTRALHGLYLTYEGEISKFISNEKSKKKESRLDNIDQQTNITSLI